MKCPNCEPEKIQATNTGRKVGGVIGTAVGALHGAKAGAPHGIFLAASGVILIKKFTRSNYLTSPNATRDFLRVMLAKETREVVKSVLENKILCHNHPSGSTEPSQADQRITSRIIQALETVDVRVLDHLIVGGAEILSFAERGLI